MISKNFRDWLALNYRDTLADQIWFGLEVFANVFDDIFTLGTAGYSFWLHWDLFNLALIGGKLVKICFQLYLEGFIL